MYALQKCCYPRCVGQSAKSWVSSPLSYKILLNLLKDEPSLQKYAEINRLMSRKKNYTIKNKVFHLGNATIKDQLVKLPDVEVEFEGIVSNDNKASELINNWAKQHGRFDDIVLGKDITVGTDFILSNVFTYNDEWKEANQEDGSPMKIFNSFNYTQDVKYEARFLDLPTRDEDVKMVIIVPNETDVLHTLFRRLNNEGLTAALASIQPSFVTTTKLDPPFIQISSETEISLQQGEDTNFKGTIIQYGNVKMDEVGFRANILTCLYSSKAATACSAGEYDIKDKAPFFFAIVVNDIPILIGQYN